MKRTILSIALVFAMMFGSVMACAEIDYSGMTLDELLDAQDQLTEAIEAARAAEGEEPKEEPEEDIPDLLSGLDESQYTLLEKGSKGDEVKALQTRLFDLGFYNIAIDGDYGNGTVKALQAFEEYNGLEPTGIATPRLQAFIFSDRAKAKDIEVASVKISTGDSKKPTVLVGGTLDIGAMASVSPENATEKGLSFAVDSEEYAVIDDKGVLSGKARGEVTVTITSLEKTENPKSATLKVKVSQPVKSIELEETAFNVGNGSTHQLTAIVGPEDADDHGVTWTSENPEIATVSSSGNVKGVDTGTTTITCIAKDGSGVSAVATVTVITAVKKVSITDKNVTLIVGDTRRLSPEVTPENATDPSLKWSSSDSSVATVDINGLVAAKAAGTCEITAEANDGSGKTATVTVYVEPHLPVMVNSITWQTTWGQKNGKMGVEAENLCTSKTIKAFDYTVVCYNYYNNTSATSYLTYQGPSFKPGATGKSKLTQSSVSGFANAYMVEITPTKVYFTDGTEVEIPSAYRYTSTFTM